MVDFKLQSPLGAIRVEADDETVTVSVDKLERVGVSVADPDRGDPTIVVWDENGEAIFTMRTGSSLDFARPDAPSRQVPIHLNMTEADYVLDVGADHTYGVAVHVSPPAGLSAAELGVWLGLLASRLALVEGVSGVEWATEQGRSLVP